MAWAPTFFFSRWGQVGWGCQQQSGFAACVGSAQGHRSPPLILGNGPCSASWTRAFGAKSGHLRPQLRAFLGCIFRALRQVASEGSAWGGGMRSLLLGWVRSGAGVGDLARSRPPRLGCGSV